MNGTMAKPPRTFSSTASIFEDPNRMEELDQRFDYGEDRIQLIGMSRGGVLFVVATLRDEDICRIISARKATRHEQDWYYAGKYESW